MFDVRLIANDYGRKQKRCDEHRDGPEAPRITAQSEGSVVLRLLISLLCAVGTYASVFMYRKGRRAKRGLLAEPSVVERPRARLFGGVPNAAIGIAYYVAMLLGVWSVHGRLWFLLEAAAAAAAGTSLFLSASLLRAKLDCRYCWASHVVNWAIVLLLPVLFV